MLASAILYQLVPFLEAVLLLRRRISHFHADALKRDTLSRSLAISSLVRASEWGVGVR